LPANVNAAAAILIVNYPIQLYLHILAGYSLKERQPFTSHLDLFKDPTGLLNIEDLDPCQRFRRFSIQEIGGGGDHE
jgi:hypothetical protein